MDCSRCPLHTKAVRNCPRIASDVTAAKRALDAGQLPTVQIAGTREQYHTFDGPSTCERWEIPHWYFVILDRRNRMERFQNRREDFLYYELVLIEAIDSEVRAIEARQNDNDRSGSNQGRG